MSQPVDWALAYAQQAKADFRAWELYEQHPEAVVAECHQLLFLQMACEKLCKAHLIQGGTPTEALRSPLNWNFHPLRLCNVPAGRTFLKLLRRAIDRIITELEH
jgi:hypothetical protein